MWLFYLNVNINVPDFNPLITKFIKWHQTECFTNAHKFRLSINIHLTENDTNKAKMSIFQNPSTCHTIPSNRDYRYKINAKKVAVKEINSITMYNTLNHANSNWNLAKLNQKIFKFSELDLFLKAITNPTKLLNLHQEFQQQLIHSALALILQMTSSSLELDLCRCFKIHFK